MAVTESSPGMLGRVVQFIVGSETVSESGSKSCLPEKCNEYCRLADRALVDMQERIVSGTVTFQLMKSLSCASKRLQVERLCAANEECYSLDAIKCSLQQRSAEHAGFVSHRTSLALICQDIETAKLKIKGSFH